MGTAPLLTLLRSATAVAHRELDASSPLNVERPTREAYATHLRALVGLTWLVETAVYTSVEGRHFVPDHARRARAERLFFDLERLGYPVDPREIAPPFPIRSAGFGIGVVYVAEGSTLGGIVLARRVERSLGPEAPVGFLRAYGEETPAMWQAFCAALAAVPPAMHEEACAGACAAFAAVAKRLFAPKVARVS